MRAAPFSKPMDERGKMRGVALGLFRGLAASYDRTVDVATAYQDRYWKRWIAEKMGLRHGTVVLDVGCGTLLLEERMSNSGSEFVGVDLTAEMARLGRAKGLANVPLVVNGDAESLPFADQSFDGAVSCYVPKYVSVDVLAAELARVVKPGGTVALYDFARPRGPAGPFLEVYIQAGLRVIGWALRSTHRPAASAFERLPLIIYGATWEREIVDAMERSGFEGVDATSLTAGVVFAYCGRKKP